MHKIASAIMHVAPMANGYGIRIRLARNLPGIWMGEGWENRPEEATAVGATATPEGWHWETHEEAEKGLERISRTIDAHNYKDTLER